MFVFFVGKIVALSFVLYRKWLTGYSRIRSQRYLLYVAKFVVSSRVNVSVVKPGFGVHVIAWPMSMVSLLVILCTFILTRVP